jgi:hypothetical protein
MGDQGIWQKKKLRLQQQQQQQERGGGFNLPDSNA